MNVFLKHLIACIFLFSLQCIGEKFQLFEVEHIIFERQIGVVLQRMALLTGEFLFIDVFLHLVGILRLAIGVVVFLEHIAIVEITHILALKLIVAKRDVAFEQFWEIIARFGIGGNTFHAVEIHGNQFFFLCPGIHSESGEHHCNKGKYRDSIAFHIPV